MCIQSEYLKHVQSTDRMHREGGKKIPVVHYMCVGDIDKAIIKKLKHKKFLIIKLKFLNKLKRLLKSWHLK